MQTNEGSLLGIVLYVCRLPLPQLCFCLMIIMGQSFRVVSYVYFLDFLSGLTELVGVTGSICCKDGNMARVL